MTRPTVATFVFTDIEGSTGLLSRRPDIYPELIAAHREIIAGTAIPRGGRMIGQEGDSCFLAFADGQAAIESVGLAQRALDEHPWRDDIALRVRMGVHTGEAETADGDYFGLAVHIAARVADAGHGGQVILSEESRSCGLPEGWSTRDLGTHRLRGIERPVRLHQLLAPGLPDDFPPLRTLPTELSRRIPPTPFVGREEDVACVADLIPRNRIVTLLGPGGIGKTRLALEVGTKAAGTFPDGAWFVDLTGTDDPDRVGELLADAVGISVRAGADPVPAVGDFFAHREGLLVIDNFEHVIEAAPVVTRIAEAAPGLRVLVTSRERLRLRGERVHDLEPLTLGRQGAAAALFHERTQAARPGFEPSEDDLDAIDVICSRLDGLPLAIELAAARCRTFRPAELARRMGEGSVTLSAGSRDVHARQQTIRDTIEWSVRLLTEAERELFGGLAVFAGPAPVEAIDAVLGRGSDRVQDDLLADLVDKSLVRQRPDDEGATRFHMLELVREHAAEMLDSRPDREPLHAAHAGHFTRQADRAADAMLRRDPDLWVARLERELADLTQAFEWNLASEPLEAVRLFGSLGFFFHVRGLTHLARRWSVRVRQVPVPEDLDTRRRIADGFVHFGFREMEAARSEWGSALEAAERGGDPVHRAWASMNLGASFIGAPGSHGVAIELVRTGIALAEAQGLPVLVGLGHNISGELHRVHGDDDAADEAYRMGIEVAERVGDHQRVAMLHGNRVYTATRRGELESALELGRTAVAVHRRHGHRNQLPWVAVAVAGAVACMGSVEEAALLLGAADEASDRMLLEEMPGDVEENRRIRAQLRAEAGARYDEWVAQGRRMSLDEVLDRVLGRQEQATWRQGLDPESPVREGRGL